MDNIRLLRVLVSFPADVAPEAIYLDSIVEKLNRIVGDSEGWRIEVVRWDRDVHAGVADDVQGVVNSQVDGQYDAVIGIFWGRAGTNTPRADSGSIEEIKRAVELSKEARGRPKVMVYFKAEGISPMDMDADQLSKLATFRGWLTDNGVLFKRFDSRAAYDTLISLDLPKAIRELLSTEAVGPIQIDKIQDRSAVENFVKSEDDELGLLDYLDMHDSAFDRMTQVMQEQSLALSRMTERIRDDSKEIDSLGGQEFDKGALRRILRRTSETWNNFSDESESKLQILDVATAEGFDSMSNALALGASSQEDQRRSLDSTLSGLVDSIKDASASVSSMRDAIGAIPRMTVEHNRAKRRLIRVLDRQIEYFNKTIASAEEIMLAIRAG